MDAPAPSPWRRMAAGETSSRAARALDDLYRAHVSEVYRYAYAVLGNHPDAEDVTQTTFVNALRALTRGERPRKPGNWLLVIAHNIIRQRLRQQQARPTEVELDRDVADGGRADDDGPSLEDLVRALQRIPPSQREAIVMRELEGRSYQEISEILDVSTSALETLLFRARRSLAEELENLVTCDKAELAMSRRLDGRLSRKERRRLDDHLSECPSCARMAERQHKHRYAFRGLAVLPAPLSVTFLHGTPSAAAVAALPLIGTGTAVVGGAGAGGAVAGGLLAGAAAKVAVVVAAVTVTGGIGYEGVTRLEDQRGPSPTTSRLRVAATDSAGTKGGTSSGATRQVALPSQGLEAVKARGKATRVGPPRSLPAAAAGTTAPEPPMPETETSQGAITSAVPAPTTAASGDETAGAPEMQADAAPVGEAERPADLIAETPTPVVAPPEPEGASERQVEGQATDERVLEGKDEPQVEANDASLDEAQDEVAGEPQAEAAGEPTDKAAGEPQDEPKDQGKGVAEVVAGGMTEVVVAEDVTDVATEGVAQGVAQVDAPAAVTDEPVKATETNAVDAPSSAAPVAGNVNTVSEPAAPAAGNVKSKVSEPAASGVVTGTGQPGRRGTQREEGERPQPQNP